MTDSGPRAVQLQLPDGTPVGVFVCTKCKSWAHGSEALAEACCESRSCALCGGELTRYRTVCAGCMQAKVEARTAARFEAATKINVNDYNGKMLYIEDDEEFIMRDELEEYLSARKNTKLPRVYATTTRRACIDAEWAIENALDDNAYEGAIDDVSLTAVRELTEYTNTWSAKHLPVSYFADTTTAIVDVNQGEPCKDVLE